MSALALIARRRGVPVSGCDADPRGAADVARAGARVVQGHDPSHVGGTRAVVYTAAVTANHPELEAARAAGIPVVSTTVGAEGLARTDGEFCSLADDPREFAAKTLAILNCPGPTRVMTERARAEVEANWDMPVLTEKLETSYRHALSEKRRITCRPDPA